MFLGHKLSQVVTSSIHQASKVWRLRDQLSCTLCQNTGCVTSIFQLERLPLKQLPVHLKLHSEMNYRQNEMSASDLIVDDWRILFEAWRPMFARAAQQSLTPPLLASSSGVMVIISGCCKRLHTLSMEPFSWLQIHLRCFFSDNASIKLETPFARSESSMPSKEADSQLFQIFLLKHHVCKSKVPSRFSIYQMHWMQVIPKIGWQTECFWR